MWFRQPVIVEEPVLCTTAKLRERDSNPRPPGYEPGELTAAPSRDGSVEEKRQRKLLDLNQPPRRCRVANRSNRYLHHLPKGHQEKSENGKPFRASPGFRLLGGSWGRYTPVSK